MSAKLEKLKEALVGAFGERASSIELVNGEITVVVPAAEYLAVATELRDRAEFGFEVLIDLCGMDYLNYGNHVSEGPRFASVVHLLSIANNWRVRLRAFAEDSEFPVLDSLVGLWPGANWYEREAFDLYGIMFAGHPDLRRILTDYGFVGHPFRKDFPVSGYVEMRYDRKKGV